MNRFRIVAVVVVLASVCPRCQPAAAFFHLWNFTEFFSSADGSVQFIELRNTSNNENLALNAQIRSASTGNVFTFPSNLNSSTTANKNLLIATAGFGSLPGGVPPDFTLPSANFFNPAGDTITLFAGFNIDSRTFSSVPTDGVQSLVYPSNTLATNSPGNFAGAVGSVNLAPPSTTGDYNDNGTVDAADYTVWRDTLGQNVAPGTGADGDSNGMIDPGDYDFWKQHFGEVVPTLATGSLRTTDVPEPFAAPLLLSAVAIACLVFRARLLRSR